MTRYGELGAEIGKLVDEKQKAYGDSFGRSHRIFQELLMGYYDPDRDVYELPRSMLPHLLTLTRMVDKLFRVVSNPTGDGMGESPYRDIAGYALLAVGREENEFLTRCDWCGSSIDTEKGEDFFLEPPEVEEEAVICERCYGKHLEQEEA